MNVNELKERVLEISHDEASPDTSLAKQALRWVNSAYHELMDELLPFLTEELQSEEILNLNNGSAVFSKFPHKVISAFHVSSKRKLKQVLKSEILELDPEYSKKGEPKFFFLEGNSLFTYPVCDEKIKVLYIPYVVDLLEDGDESSILLPKPFHNALIWGALVWGATYERGFSSGADLKLFQAKWEEAKRAIKLSLLSKPSSILRVNNASDVL